MNASEVMNEILSHENMTYGSFAKKIGVTPKEVYDIQNGRTKSITEKFAAKILREFPYYNQIWLRTGYGDMCVPEDTSMVMEDVQSYVAIKKQGTAHLEGTPRMTPHIIEECADCGQPNGFEVAIMEDKCPKYVIPGLTGCDFTIPARGRSMINRMIPEKSIRDGDIIGCRKWTSRTHIRWGEVYVLSTTGGITVKQIQPSEQEGFVKCIPFNTDEGFQPFELPVDEIYDWAIVVGVASVSMWA